MGTERFERDYDWYYARGIIHIGFTWNMTVRSSQDDGFDIIWDSIYFVTIYLIKFGTWVVWKWAIYMCTCILYKTKTDHYIVTLNMYKVTDQTKICMHFPDWMKRTYNESLARIKIKVWKYSGHFTINKKKYLPSPWFEPSTYPQIRRPTLYPLSHTRRCIRWCEKRIIIDTRHTGDYM